MVLKTDGECPLFPCTPCGNNRQEVCGVELFDQQRTSPQNDAVGRQGALEGMFPGLEHVKLIAVCREELSSPRPFQPPIG